MSATTRRAEHGVHPLFIQRWSRRSFADLPIAADQLHRLFEAARWAPSAQNAQPWRFLYALRDGAHWNSFLDLIYERNRIWAQRSAALIAVLSQRVRRVDGVDKSWRTHAFDAGAAWANLSLQASLMGLSARAMGGVDLDRARAVLALPQSIEIHAIVAIGWPGDPGSLPEHLRDLDTPNAREPLSHFVFEGPFPA